MQLYSCNHVVRILRVLVRVATSNSGLIHREVLAANMSKLPRISELYQAGAMFHDDTLTANSSRMQLFVFENKPRIGSKTAIELSFVVVCMYRSVGGPCIVVVFLRCYCFRRTNGPRLKLRDDVASPFASHIPFALQIETHRQ